MKLADRIHHLGTETVFAVSAAATARAARGHKVYPFHIGDINLPTPPTIVAAQARAIAEGKKGYCPPEGIHPLRAALAEDVGRERGLTYHVENVAVQPGGKPVIGKFLQTLMNPGDEVLCPSPGFPIYESQIEYLGGVCKHYRFIPNGAGFAIDFDYLKTQITPKTKLLIFNNCQNPTAAESDQAEINALAELATKHNLWVLSDEAYTELRYDGKKTCYLPAVPGMQNRTVILYTFSKKFAMTGWRLGAAIGPADLIRIIGQLNLNDESCTTQFVQWAGVEALRNAETLKYVHQMMDTLHHRRDVGLEKLNSIKGIKCHKPENAFYLFPDVTEAMHMKGFTDVNAFAHAALEHANVSFATRRHFCRPLAHEQRHYVRMSYSGISAEDIDEGLGHLKVWIES
jgi:aspartate/methionine/tyrosine aminotransferase